MADVGQDLSAHPSVGRHQPPLRRPPRRGLLAAHEELARLGCAVDQHLDTSLDRMQRTIDALNGYTRSGGKAAP